MQFNRLDQFPELLPFPMAQQDTQFHEDGLEWEEAQQDTQFPEDSREWVEAQQGTQFHEAGPEWEEEEEFQQYDQFPEAGPEWEEVHQDDQFTEAGPELEEIQQYDQWEEVQRDEGIPEDGLRETDPGPLLLGDWYQMDPEARRALVLQRLDYQLSRVDDFGETSLEYPTLWNRNNVQFSREFGLQPLEEDRASLSWIYGSSLRKFLHLLDVMRILVETNTRTTKRDIFYQHVTMFSSQRELDRLVIIAVAMLQVPRLYLGVVATSKGLVAGRIKWTNEEGVTVDCSLAVGGETIPQDVPELSNIVVMADFLVVVEKDAIFQRLLEEGVFSSPELSRAIFVTGKGVPDIATRQLVNYLSRDLPVFVLTDCDPYGLEIFFTYKYGSLSSCWSQEPLSVPSSLWLGVHPGDVEDLGLSNSRLKAYSDVDRKRILDYDQREYVTSDPEIRNQLEAMWNLQRKVEIQQVFEEREPGFLVNDYLPGKLRVLVPGFL